MDTENKYYVPSIEEFHIGFEYEHYTKDWVNEEDKKEYKHTWVKCYFNKNEDYGQTFDNIEYFIETEQIKVKYLDQQDIESLGWTYHKLENNVLFFSKDVYFLQYCLDDYFISILKNVGETTNINCTCPIKNKSEFKKLMLQLNISE